MDLRSVSLSDLYLYWTLFWTIVLGTIAFFRAPNGLRGILGALAEVGGAVLLLAAMFSVAMYAAIKLA